MVVTLFQKTGPPRKQETPLASQEVKLLSLLSEGFGYESAALQMNISINTVRNYIRSTYEKLHVHSSAGAPERNHRLTVV